jgi:hypothetical protein
MGTSVSFINRNSFDPELTHAMSAALDSAWVQLVAAGRAQTMPYMAATTREGMASAILELARKGVSDPQQLTAAALMAALAARASRDAQQAHQATAP